MRIVGIIPARYASSRFPGKPLVDIAGKSMIQRVVEQAQKASRLSDVIVATDDERIKNAVINFGGKAFMTAESHPSGTDRCAEVLETLPDAEGIHYAVNIQGDEPFIEPQLIDDLCALLDGEVEIASAMLKINELASLQNPNVVKVVVDRHMQALYFSRQAIPFVREATPEAWLNKTSFFRHIGIYAYRCDILKDIVKLPQAELENLEKLEQLRWMANGYTIKMLQTNFESIGIDTPEDLLNLKLP